MARWRYLSYWDSNIMAHPGPKKYNFCYKASAFGIISSSQYLSQDCSVNHSLLRNPLSMQLLGLHVHWTQCREYRVQNCEVKEGNIKAGIRSLPATLISILKFASLSLKPYKMIKPKHVEFRVVKEYLLYHYLTYNPREDSITQWPCLHFKLSSHCLIRELPIPLIFLLQRNASVIVQKKKKNYIFRIPT